MSQNLLLLHGALGSKKQLQPLKQFLELHFNLYDLNFEGHGGTISSEPFSIALFAQNLIDFIEENELEGTAVFGYSMGGYVAINAVNQRPGIIGDIVTLGTKFNWSLESAEREVKMLNPEKIEEKVPKFAAKLQREHDPQDWKEVMNKTAQMMLEMGNGQRLSESQLSQVSNRINVGIGLEDKMVSLEESKWAVENLTNASLHTFSDFPHPIEMVNVEVLGNHICEVLQKS